MGNPQEAIEVASVILAFRWKLTGECSTVDESSKLEILG
jgi:hypothetical protein